uniref:Uncharacterized protein n=1 Tax=Sphaerodactylus townsendi TaxID=933632 RepID=A0ACB8FN24_9SAUR
MPKYNLIFAASRSAACEVGLRVSDSSKELGSCSISKAGSPPACFLKVCTQASRPGAAAAAAAAANLRLGIPAPPLPAGPAQPLPRGCPPAARPSGSGGPRTARPGRRSLPLPPAPARLMCSSQEGEQERAAVAVAVAAATWAWRFSDRRCGPPSTEKSEHQRLGWATNPAEAALGQMAVSGGGYCYSEAGRTECLERSPEQARRASRMAEAAPSMMWRGPRGVATLTAARGEGG